MDASTDDGSVGSASHRSETHRGDTPATATSQKASDVRTVEQLLLHAYEQGGKRFTVPATAMKALAQRLDDENPDHLRAFALERAAADPYLAVPPRLLVAVDSSPAASGAVRQAVIALMTAVLRQNPVFQASELQSALDGAPLDRDETFGTLTRATKSPTRGGATGDERDAATRGRARLRSNAVTSMAMLLAMRDRWPTHELINCLNRHVWQDESERVRRVAERATIADSRQADVLGLVSTSFESQLRRLEQQRHEQEEAASAAHRRVLEAESRLEQVQGEFERLSREAEQRESDLEELRSTLEEERRHRLIDRSHHVDDYENLRTRMVRMLSMHTDLLEDGLHALRNGSTAVTEEFIERSVNSLGNELSELKNEKGGAG